MQLEPRNIMGSKYRNHIEISLHQIFEYLPAIGQWLGKMTSRRNDT